MKVINSKINKSLRNLKVQFKENFFATRFANGEQLLRSELFSADQMEQHGRHLANSHIIIVQPKIPGHNLLTRLADNEEFLFEVHNLLTETLKMKNPITPASEWLLDNFYLIEEQIHTGKRYLPKGYIRELPLLTKGPSKNLPRVYDIALETISHGDGRVDPENLIRFISSYQTVKKLKLGELWAIPNMLRLALIENLRRVAARIASGRIERDLADVWADKMIETAEKDPKSLILIIADMARTDPPMTTSFVSEFVRRVQGISHLLVSPLTWIEQRLSESGQTIERLIQTGNQEQAADQVSISNSIGSLRFLDSMDWHKFVESMSSVEHILLKDINGAYGKMDFATRDRYRHVVEKIAKRSRLPEEQIAQTAIDCAHESAAIKGDDDRTAHVGYYLIDKGLKKLENSVNIKFSFPTALVRLTGRFSFFFYLAPILLIAMIITFGLSSKAADEGLVGWEFYAMSFLFLFCAVQLGIELVNHLSTLLVNPEPLPKFDFSEGIPAELSTLVVIPSILIDDQNIKELAESLEVRFLANRNENLYFGLLTDFQDSDKENEPEDASLVLTAVNKILELNEKYNQTNKDTFFLFHRPRQWNADEKMWMGYERKRGKLTELNALLRGKGEERFSTIIGKKEILPLIKYVITLDTDTQLPRESAAELIGAMNHPLNRVHFDKTTNKVIDGYSILQPRVEVSLPGSTRSLYARLNSSQAGIDPYTRTVSDIYQDVFGEGSFIGKGIYDVDVFVDMLGKYFPENLILSHDLIEGCHVRSGLLSDVQLYEDYPSGYKTDAARRHRWIRGDWQIIRWLFPWVADLTGKFKKNPLSSLSRWKIFDNLRRSIMPLALTLFFVLSWILLKEKWFWSLTGLGFILIPSLLVIILDLFRKPKDILFRQHLLSAVGFAKVHLAQSAFTLITLPFEAYNNIDAVARTFWRMLFSHKKLLEWNSSHSFRDNSGFSLISSFKMMWIAPLVSVAAGGYLIHLFQSLNIAVIPFLLLWISSPVLAWRLSLPLKKEEANLTDSQKLFLRALSRKTWSFFETFVGPDDNWLPPDNFQENPVGVIAHRTSPTNIGLALLSNLSAYDFGYITAGQLIDRVNNSFITMEKMERHRGHFYNWYDTVTLEPLKPLYISSVDSGNLAAHLLTLKQGLLSIPDEKIVGVQVFEGLNDTLNIVFGLIGKKEQQLLMEIQDVLRRKIKEPNVTLLEMWHALDQIVLETKKIENAFKGPAKNPSVRWFNILAEQSLSALNELNYLAPWILIVVKSNKVIQFPFSESIPTLNEVSELGNEFFAEAGKRARKRIELIRQSAAAADKFSEMDYSFLYNKKSRLITIGYNVEDKKCDSSSYDLLASEARLSCFVAIAQGQIPQESWFALGRLLTNISGEPILLSWSGSMFEYLMPLLIMPVYESTLLYQTYKAAVKRQIEYGKLLNVPWGISESGYNTIDINQNYQYRAFGVPGLGLKRGLSEDLVVAPYASALALMVEPEKACQNLQELASEGILGDYGFYEAIDYTSSRVPRDKSNVVIKSFMAHHQGMSFLALAYLIHDQSMQKRFTGNPLFESTLLLLQEKIPRATIYYSHTHGLSDINTTSNPVEVPLRKFSNPDMAIPEVQLLSNGRYNVMVTSAGGGYSKWKDIALTRWHEDSTCDNWGTYCYIRDLEKEEFWSSSYQPVLKRSKNYEAIFSEGHAEFRQSDQNIDTHTEIVVSPEDDIELRRIHLKNKSKSTMTIDVTSYAEIVLASAASDALHPAFSNLFVQTEIIKERHSILCTRRPRSADEKSLWFFHMMIVRGVEVDAISYETDRLQFIGRGNSITSPKAMQNADPLTDSQGSVLDPIAAIRYKLIIKPDETAVIDMIYGLGETHESTLNMIDKYQDRRLANRVFELSWTHTQVVLQQLNASESDAQLYGRLANSVIYSNSFLRADPSVIAKNRRGQPGLWGYSISGDLPIVLLQIEDSVNINLVKQMVQAHAYWRLKGLSVDLVIWNEDHAGYRQQLQEQIMRLIAADVEANFIDRPGGIFIRQGDQISNEDRILIQTVARVIISDKNGTLEEQIKYHIKTELPVRRLKGTKTYRPERTEDNILSRTDLLFFNGYGGFTNDGKEYVISTSCKHFTPAPWSNVIANPYFGTIVTENGPSYTWFENAHEFRLTPWNNDPVSDTNGEAFYLRDEETGHFWSPTPLPSCGSGSYLSRHGFGYTVYEHIESGIRTELWIYVSTVDAIKFSVLKIWNESGRQRKLSATGYAELVLGDLRAKTVMHIVTEIDPDSGALFSRNSYNHEFPGRISFFQTDDRSYSITCDRSEFIGRNGTLRNPSAMTRTHLSGKTGAGLDPCAAIQVPFELADGQEREVIFKLGAAKNSFEVNELVNRYNGSMAARNALESVWQYWNESINTVHVETPDPSIDVIANGWLLYQTLSARIWGRSGYYQSGGAFGFRDQLQDVLSLVHSKPALIRSQILLCASRQFLEGDVQHWWHPPGGRGVRTQCSDDYLWLPFAVSRYVFSTGDTGVLDESVNFLEGRPVNFEEDSYYDLPIRSEKTAVLYEHCVIAIKRALKFGRNGLPFIGTGDWNDGMNKVGIEGKGESVWLGFFLYDLLMKFTKIAGLRGDIEFAELCRNEAEKLSANIEKNAWDGEWYRRAYFDDGTPLGSSQNQECRIDSISQSWSVISGAGNPERVLKAMDSFDKKLVRRDHGLIQLLDPPFDKSELNPGYIKGYVPGVRENGGQYTHAAIWAAMAYAKLGNRKLAWDLFNIINPVNHGKTPEAIAKYKVEPYVAAADVYALTPHIGRGGWTWYTGSSGWMYRLILESLLGLRLEADKLYFEPCIPEDWDTYKISYKYRNTTYNITFYQSKGSTADITVTVDGADNPEKFIRLTDDNQVHYAEVKIII